MTGVPQQSRILDIMASAIQSANLDDPGKDDGTQRKRVYLNDEDSIHLARAAVRAIEDAGYMVVLKDKDHSEATGR